MEIAWATKRFLIHIVSPFACNSESPYHHIQCMKIELKITIILSRDGAYFQSEASELRTEFLHWELHRGVVKVRFDRRIVNKIVAEKLFHHFLLLFFAHFDMVLKTKGNHRTVSAESTAQLSNRRNQRLPWASAWPGQMGNCRISNCSRTTFSSTEPNPGRRLRSVGWTREAGAFHGLVLSRLRPFGLGILALPYSPNRFWDFRRHFESWACDFWNWMM